MIVVKIIFVKNSQNYESGEAIVIKVDARYSSEKF